MRGLSGLIQTWTEREQELRLNGAEGLAQLCQRMCRELRRALEGEPMVVVTLKEASERSGYTIDHLRKLIRKGRLPNRGARGRPLVRVGDLPRKPGLEPPGLGVHILQTSRQQVARSPSLEGDRR